MKVFGGKTLPVTDKSVYYLKPDGTWKSWPKPKLSYNRMRAGCIYFKRKYNFFQKCEYQNCRPNGLSFGCQQERLISAYFYIIGGSTSSGYGISTTEFLINGEDIQRSPHYLPSEVDVSKPQKMKMKIIKTIIQETGLTAFAYNQMVHIFTRQGSIYSLDPWLGWIKVKEEENDLLVQHKVFLVSP